MIIENIIQKISIKYSIIDLSIVVEDVIQIVLYSMIDLNIVVYKKHNIYET